METVLIQSNSIQRILPIARSIYESNHSITPSIKSQGLLLLIVPSIILALDLLDDVLHLLTLPRPLHLPHLGLPAEQLLVRFSVAAT